MLINYWLEHRLKQVAIYGCIVSLVMASAMAHPVQAQSATPYLYTVPPGGALQFPVRNGPATDDYVSLEQMCGIGKTLPIHDLTDVQGKPFALSSLRGKIAVLDFWGTTCGPCLRAMPHLGKLANEYRSQVVFLSVCESPNDGTGFRNLAARYHATELRFLMDPSAQQGRKSLRDLLHNGMGQPTQLIVDQEGQVVGALQGYDDTNDPKMTLLRHSIEIVLHSHSSASNDVLPATP